MFQPRNMKKYLKTYQKTRRHIGPDFLTFLRAYILPEMEILLG
jgi:hypothetical protein